MTMFDTVIVYLNLLTGKEILNPYFLIFVSQTYMNTTTLHCKT